MASFNQFQRGPIMGAVAAIGSAIGGAASSIGGVASSLGSLGGMFGGGSSSGAANQAAMMQAAMLANAERQKISDSYFDTLIGAREVQRGPNKGDTRYGKTKELMFGNAPVDVFGRRPTYYEVDFDPMLDQDPGLANLAGDVTRGNIRNFDQNAQLAAGVNNFLTEDARGRVGAFDPYLLGNIERSGRNAALASQGILPTSDAESIVGNRNEMAGIFGTAGTSRGQVAKDLGLARLDLQTRIAPSLMQGNTAMINAIAPPQMRDDPRSSQVSQQQAIQVGAADNQFESEFDRREMSLRAMLESMPDPQAQGMFNLQNTLRAQQFMIDFGLANGMGIPGTMPDNLGGEGMAGFSQGMGAGGGIFSSLFGGGSVGTPGIFG